MAGNLVVPGVGYTGSSPAGVAPAAGTSWIYATGAMFGFRSDVYAREFPGTFDRAKNFCTRLSGDAGAVFATIREAFFRFGDPEGHVTLDITESANTAPRVFSDAPRTL